jgi:hypothetical protein
VLKSRQNQARFSDYNGKDMIAVMTSRVWKDGKRRGIAYVEGRETAERIMMIAGRRRLLEAAASGTPPVRRRIPTVPAEEMALDGAMAVYSDKRGKPFAWQIPFDIGCWEKVAEELGVTVESETLGN